MNGENMEKLNRLNLQFFASDETGGQPSAEEDSETKKEDVKVPEVQKDEKQPRSFTQEQVDEIVVRRLTKERERLFKKLNIDNEDKIQEILNRSKEYDTLKSENEIFKAKELKSSYMSQMSNVKENYTELIYNSLQPNKDEKPEDYKVRVDEYLKTHAELAKQEEPKEQKKILQPVGISTRIETTGDNGDKKSYNIAEALYERQKKN